MTAILETAPLTVEVIEAANPFEPNGGPMEGRYILRRGLRPSAVLLGHALVRETGGDYIFAALLTNGTELRGRFDEAEEGGLRSELTGVRDERGVHAANGRAEITAPGVFEFTGQFTVEEGSVTGTATRTPE
jgi:hypothetical protein